MDERALAAKWLLRTFALCKRESVESASTKGWVALLQSGQKKKRRLFSHGRLSV